MMKKVFLLPLMLQSFLGITQNLVQNPSFENYSSCTEPINSAIGWSDFLNTCDYFNICASSQNYLVPLNAFGYQNAHTGNAYAGLIPFQVPSYTEILGCQLSSATMVGQKYYISFYVSFTLPQTGGSNTAINKLGAKFTVASYIQTDPISINNIAPVYSNNIITDTANWVQIMGSLVADSAYQYIAIGNFFDNSHIDTLRMSSSGGPNTHSSYYYIDDVCVSTDSVYAATWATGMKHFSNSEINIYPNPTNKLLNIA